MLFCGFNGFQQFDYLLNNADDIQGRKYVSKFIECPKESCTDASMTWSNALIVKDNHAVISGFLNGNLGQSVSLKTPDNEDITQGTCNKKNCFLVTTKGKCWQYNLESSVWKEVNFIQLSDSIDNVLIKVAVGEIVTAALNNKGEVWNFGSQLSSPEMNVVDVDCGKEHGILVTESGYVYTWGSGSRGQLGNGALDNSEEICEVHLLAGLNISKISAGGWHNAVLSRDGDIYTWGWNKQGQLGHPTLDENGEVWGCGWNKWGQLGTTGFQSTHIMFKLEVSTLLPIRNIKCSAWNTVIIC